MGGGSSYRRRKFAPEEAAELRAKGFRFSIYRPDEDEFRLSLPLQTIEDREHGMMKIGRGQGAVPLREDCRACVW